jgi:hypothetical protein
MRYAYNDPARDTSNLLLGPVPDRNTLWKTLNLASITTQGIRLRKRARGFQVRFRAGFVNSGALLKNQSTIWSVQLPGFYITAIILSLACTSQRG